MTALPTLACAQQPRRLPNRFLLDPEDRPEPAAPRGDGIDGGDADLCIGKLAEKRSQRAHSIVALQQETCLALAQLESGLPGGSTQRGAVFGNEIELPLASAAWKPREGEEIDSLTRQRGQDLGALPGAIRHHDVEVVDPAQTVAHPILHFAIVAQFATQ